MPFIEVNCPVCGKRVFKVTDKTVNSLSAKCSYCNKLVTYKGLTKSVSIVDIPKRKTSSGTRFY